MRDLLAVMVLGAALSLGACGDRADQVGANDIPPDNQVVDDRPCQPNDERKDCYWDDGKPK